MREIKFRIYFKDEEPFMSEPITLEDLLFEDWIEFENEEVSLPLKDFRFYYNKKGDSYKIMQYTGLKDKNEKEIYEGDILKIPEWLWQDNQEICVCIYAEEHQTNEVIGFGLYIKDGYSGEYKISVPSDEWDEFEVIGNIYENPELLKGE